MNLRQQIDACLDKIVTGTEIEVVETLGPILKGRFPAEELMPKLQPLRNAHPKGLSIRHSKRRPVLDAVFKIVEHAVTTEWAQRRRAQNEAKELKARQEEIDSALSIRTLDAEKERRRVNKVEQERKILADRKQWWLTTFPTCSFEELLKRLDEVPSEHVNAVLDRLMQLPTSPLLISAKQLWGFYTKNLNKLATRPYFHEAPSVVAFAAYLINEGNYPVARNLLEKLASLVSSPFQSLVQYLQFVLQEPLELSGNTLFSQLSEEDIFLAACYYNDGPARHSLDSVRKWDWASVQNHLKVPDDPHGNLELNHFLVKGLQPRIAELAFRKVREVLYPGVAKENLTDLNLQVVQKLSRPWRRYSVTLPGADWGDVSGERFDAKCNLYYRSKNAKLGLRGLLINRNDGGKKTYSGFIVTDASEEACSWTYVGDYIPESADRKGGKVLPFYFRIPESACFSCQLTEAEVELGMQLLPAWKLQFGWCLANGRLPVVGINTLATNEAKILLRRLFDKALSMSERMSLEFGLWQALTEITLVECFTQRKYTVMEFLRFAGEITGGRELPVKLPKIDSETLLYRWIKEVLRPFCGHSDRIKCPTCSSNNIRMELKRMTAEGAIMGNLHCNTCQPGSETEMTILVHCHECGHYPLIIGKNPTCTSCNGLVCDCGQCKQTCREGYKRTRQFVTEPRL